MPWPRSLRSCRRRGSASRAPPRATRRLRGIATWTTCSGAWRRPGRSSRRPTVPAPRDPKAGAPAGAPRGTPSRRRPFEYAIVRIVPRVERGERFNAGVIVHSRPHRFLGARVWLDEAVLLALAPEGDAAAVQPHLDAIVRIAAGDASAGPLAQLTRAERFHWLVSPSSTVVQRSER